MNSVARAPVCAWLASPPAWLQIVPAPAPLEELPLPALDDGERSGDRADALVTRRQISGPSVFSAAKAQPITPAKVH